MDVVLIGDQTETMNQLERELMMFSNIKIVGTFTQGSKVLTYIEKLNPQVIFLDVKIGEICGLELAKQIQEKLPEIIIAFVTEHKQFAAKAFELNAIDYLIKPVSKERLLKTIQRIHHSLGNHSTVKLKEPFVRCFRSFQFTYLENLDEVIEPKWRTAKTKSLFLYLLHNRNQYIRKDNLIDHFWPDANIKSGSAQLYTTIYNIRQTMKNIGFPITIESYENSYKLNLNNVKIDIEEWEQGLKLLDPITEKNYSEFKKILNLYQGAYLEEEQYVWAQSEQQRLRMIWSINIKKFADFLIEKGEYSEAIIFYLQVLKIDPLAEDCYFMLMKLYDKIGERYLVEVMYNNLKTILNEEYGITPVKHIEDWYNKWKENQLVRLAMNNGKLLKY